eukprot:CAMPEP_0119134784 /NCGR_PEP_ID=MMETSP1310-20130426/17846_1 /TAXON_ID=464262 /ORGANISM="Genus nov. species nov., Strain RCC2339" /LENGTH=410 /DNA_ID=CAMNT_0007125615 /DNA_START=100 /DNA_END=1332 /DNA_ORIENTATION=+
MPDPKSIMLGIETSCDDTCVSLVNGGGYVLHRSVENQISLNEKFGGVNPAAAKEAHEQIIDDLVQQAFDVTGVSPTSLAGVAATAGPGLRICLEVGLQKALDVAKEYNKPFFPIHHLEGHILVSELKGTPITFPTLCFVASGGHTQLILARSVGDYKILAGTLDDAVGEAYDKVARMLCLADRFGATPHGGALVERAAREFSFLGKRSSEYVPVSVPFLRDRDVVDFSFSGMKTSIARHVQKISNGPAALQKMADVRGNFDNETSGAIAMSFQVAVAKHIQNSFRRALLKLRDSEEEDVPRSLFFVGGVAQNRFLYRRISQACSEFGVENVICPPPQLCTDNAEMIAWAGLRRQAMGVAPGPSELAAYPRWSLDADIPNMFQYCSPPPTHRHPRRERNVYGDPPSLKITH